MSMQLFRHGRVEKPPRKHLEVSEEQALTRLADHGFDPGLEFLRPMRIGSPDTGRGYALICDYRRMPAEYLVAWVISVFDGDDYETHRYSVPRES